MNAKIKVDIDVDKILRLRGLGNDHKAQKKLATLVAKKCEPYVPMQSGSLKNDAVIADDGSSITYPDPYAHYQYYGEVMAGRAPKHYTGRDIDYSGAPMRGKEWDKRMLADKQKELLEDFAKAVGGKIK